MSNLKAPLMILHSEEQDENQRTLSFYNVQDQKVHGHGRQYMPRNLLDSRFCGSSHGWVMVLDQKSDPFLLNPFSLAQIQLPPSLTLPHILGVLTSNGYEDFHFLVGYKTLGFETSRTMSSQDLQHGLFLKGVLSCSPSDNSSFKVMIMYGYGSYCRLAFFKHGGKTKWAHLDGKHGPYSDIIYYNDHLVAISDNGSIEAWNFQDTYPIKTMDMNPSFPQRKIEPWLSDSTRDLYTRKRYLVESLGEILVVTRYVGEFVRQDGTPISEADLLSDEDPHPLICPYRTLKFSVYQLNFTENKLVDVDNLRDRTIFVGGNHSESISTLKFPDCKKNSIYFSDDYWERMNEDYLYGGHDLGLFCLEDGSVKQFCPGHSENVRIEPAPIWLVPKS